MIPINTKETRSISKLRKQIIQETLIKYVSSQNKPKDPELAVKDIFPFINRKLIECGLKTIEIE